MKSQLATNEAEGLTLEDALKNVLHKRRDAGFSGWVEIVTHRVIQGEYGRLIHYIYVEGHGND